jgi:hypothetical protein
MKNNLSLIYNLLIFLMISGFSSLPLIRLFEYYKISISFPEHARSQVRGGHSSGEIELIPVEFPT